MACEEQVTFSLYFSYEYSFVIAAPAYVTIYDIIITTLTPVIIITIIVATMQSMCCLHAARDSRRSLLIRQIDKGCDKVWTK